MAIYNEIAIKRIKESQLSKVDFNNLDFGKYVSDHMVHTNYDNKAWGKPEIIPYGDLMMSPAMLSIHYGQSIFEGMKAFKMQDGNINIFRLKKHHSRINKSLARMCMPEISEALFTETLHALVELDHQWVPTNEGSSLYIRPVVFATEARLGVKVSDQYKFIIMTTPVGPYFTKPYKLKVEDYYVRTAEGGTGFAKCAGNYGGAFYPTQVAKEEGFDQVLWTDHKDHQYIDEVGMMNVMFVIGGKLITPALNTAILDGVTRDSILTLAKKMNFPTEERRIKLEELEQGFKDKSITEAFGAGTAAVVAPIQSIRIHGIDYSIPLPDENSFQSKVKKQLFQIRTGLAEDTYKWNYIVKIK
ncbi:MAG: branched-chain amino acid aminotransferase [Cyclobacteriaceae bacterium]